MPPPNYEGDDDKVMVQYPVGDVFKKESAEGSRGEGIGQGESFIQDHIANSPTKSTASLTVINRRSRRNSVQMACERCRRRKIKCSGLPGPCQTCVNLGAVCHDPAKRQDRSQSLLENRIQRLEAMAMQNRAKTDSEPSLMLPHHPQTGQVQIPFVAHEPRGTLHLQTQNLSRFQFNQDINQLSPFSAPAWDRRPQPNSPACYSDSGPELSPWSTNDQSNDFYNPSPESTSKLNPSLHRRAQTFPTFLNDGFTFGQPDDKAEPSSAFSEIPCIQITSPASSELPSPRTGPTNSFSPIGFSIPYCSTLFDNKDGDVNDFCLDQPPRSPPRTPPLHAMHFGVDEQMDYYGERLSPFDRPPPNIAHSPSITSLSDFGTSYLDGYQCGMAPTIPSFATPNNLGPNSNSLAITLTSPRTQKYLNIYFQTIHPKNPFLDPSSFKLKSTSQFSPMHSYQTLLCAALGAMKHHQSRSVSSTYIRLAMSLPNIDFTGSISGVHCAILLGSYCLSEETISFADEVDRLTTECEGMHITQNATSSLNLWLHTTQTANAIIELGLQLGMLVLIDSPNGLIIGPGKEIIHNSHIVVPTADMYGSTFRATWDLDRQVARFKRRPRAFRATDVSPQLALHFMLEVSEE